MSDIVNIPQLRFSEFSGEWNNLLLGNLLSFKNGINASKEQYGQGYKFINVLDIINNITIKYEDIIGSVNVSKEIFEKNKIEYGNILFQRSSETRSEAGQTSVYLDKEKFATFGGFVIRGKQKQEYNPEFMNYMFKTQHARKEITQKSNGSTRYNVGQETLSKVFIYLPSKQEQEKIATFLSSVDTKIEQLTSKAKLLQEYKKGVMQKIFSQEIRFKDDNGSEFPEWENEFLDRLIDKGRKIRYGIVQPGKYDENGRYLIRGKDYSNGWEKPDGFFKVSEKIEQKYHKARVVTGDIILCIVGSVGNTMVIPDWLDGANITQTTARIAPLENKLFNIYLYYYFQSLVGRIMIHKHTRVGTRPGLNIEDVEKFLIILPSLEEQTKIANYLSSIDSKIEQTQKQLDSTKEFKKALLQQMFV